MSLETAKAAPSAAMPRDEGTVSYEMLQDLLRAERRSNKLMPLAPRFWVQVREFLQAVTDAFRLEQARDPFGRKVMRLTDEVKNARHAAESIWALRERKLAMLALAAVKERKAPDGITPDEAELYRALLAALDAGRGKVFDGILPEAAAAAASAPGVGPPGVPSPVATGAVPAAASPALPPVQMPIQDAAGVGAPPFQPAAEPAAPAQEPPASGPSSAAAVPVVPADTKGAQEMVTIRALGDIPPFVGPDMQTYLLKEGDIATVPPSIANLLVRRNKAAVVEA